MITKKVLAALGVAALGIALVVAPAFAAKKKCPKLCKDGVAACVTAATTAANCGALTGKDKRTCNKELRATKKACKKDLIALCKTRLENETTCSPSGAFLD